MDRERIEDARSRRHEQSAKCEENSMTHTCRTQLVAQLHLKKEHELNGQLYLASPVLDVLACLNTLHAATVTCWCRTST